MAQVVRHGKPPTLGYYVLHEGLIGNLGEQGLQEYTYDHVDKEPLLAPGTHGKVWKDAVGGFVGITDKYWAAAVVPDQARKYEGRYLLGADRQRSAPTRPISWPRPSPSRRAPAAATQARLFAGAKEVAAIDGYEKNARHQALRAADRLGLVLFHHQADVLRDGLDLQACRQFRHRDPGRHAAAEGRVLPARQQILRLDGEDEGGAAGDDGDPRALCRRQDEAAAGSDGAVQDPEDQPDRGLLAGAAADPGVLRALQDPVRHHRDAARAVLRLDPRSRRARSDHDLQPVRPAALRRAGLPAASAPGRS